MKNQLDSLLERIARSRTAFITAVDKLTDEQARLKPAPAEWSVLEITEHMVWAEQIGVCGMFNAIQALKSGTPIWKGTSPNAGLTIEEIVAKTWQPKEVVPKVAEPRWGGSLQYWITCLKNAQLTLVELQQLAEDVDLTVAIYPHPISGPMDIIQRLEFLSFHLDRHRDQVERVKSAVLH